MEFKAKDIGEEGVDVDLPVTPAWLASAAPGLDARVAKEGLRFDGRLEPSGDDFLLRGHLGGALEMPCSRCLEPARLPIDTDVSVLFVEKETNRGRGQDDDQEDEALEAPDVMTFEEGVIDLGAELRDEILLAIPTQVLCKEECAGLCPECGVNRNVESCDCAEKQRLARSKFAELGKLKI